MNLIDFVASFKMGEFYSKKISELVGPLKRAFVISLGGGPGPDPAYERQRCKANIDYRQKLNDNTESAKFLIVELLRYQSWTNA